jgi:drug/metabolite transporter (DMT)-like permease
MALIGAIVTVAIGYAVGAKLSKELGGWQVTCWAITVSLPFSIIPAFYFAPESYASIATSTYLSIFYLALVSQLLAFFAWYKGLALGGIARVSQVQLLQVFATIFASVLLLGESVERVTIVFAVLVVGLVWLGKRMPINTV